MRRTHTDQRAHLGAATFRRRARTGGIAITAVGLLLLTACGGDDDDPSAVAVPTTAVGAPESSGPASTTGPTTTLIPVTTVTPGDITETVPSQPEITAAPAAIDATVESDAGVAVAVTDVQSIDVEASLPGETSGPGVSLVISIANGTPDPLDLSAVAVELTDAAGEPATQIASGSTPFAGAIAAGESQTATYVFRIDEAVRGDVTLLITYSADEPIVVFTGSLG